MEEGRAGRNNLMHNKHTYVNIPTIPVPNSRLRTPQIHPIQLVQHIPIQWQHPTNHMNSTETNQHCSNCGHAQITHSTTLCGATVPVTKHNLVSCSYILQRTFSRQCFQSYDGSKDTSLDLCVQGPRDQDSHSHCSSSHRCH